MTGDFGSQTLALINSYRASRGLSPLAANGTLKALAQQHSRYQAARRSMSHYGFRQRSAQARAAGLSVVCSENVAMGYTTPQQLFAGWRRSWGHNTNLLRPNLRYAGVPLSEATRLSSLASSIISILIFANAGKCQCSVVVENACSIGPPRIRNLGNARLWIRPCRLRSPAPNAGTPE
nr:CAP domain-containing protein [Rhizobium sp. 42MFCr.1]